MTQIFLTRDSQKLYTFKSSERVECLNLKTMRVKRHPVINIYLPTTENRIQKNAIIINNNNGAIDVGFGNFLHMMIAPYPEKALITIT